MTILTLKCNELVDYHKNHNVANKMDGVYKHVKQFLLLDKKEKSLNREISVIKKPLKQEPKVSGEHSLFSLRLCVWTFVEFKINTFCVILKSNKWALNNWMIKYMH